MKKRILSVMAILAMLFAPVCVEPVNAQIIIMDEEEEEENNRTESGVDDPELPNIPELGITIDQFGPVGDGILVLAALGGAYLIGKKRKEND